VQLMLSCGMYNGSGAWACTVGLPAKSGAAGCILLVVPNVMGMAVFSPPLDKKGNSVRGVKLVESVAEQYNLNIFSQLYLGVHKDIVEKLEDLHEKASESADARPEKWHSP